MKNAAVGWRKSRSKNKCRHFSLHSVVGFLYIFFYSAGGQQFAHITHLHKFTHWLYLFAPGFHRFSISRSSRRRRKWPDGSSSFPGTPPPCPARKAALYPATHARRSTRRIISMAEASSRPRRRMIYAMNFCWWRAAAPFGQSWAPKSVVNCSACGWAKWQRSEVAHRTFVRNVCVY